MVKIDKINKDKKLGFVEMEFSGTDLIKFLRIPLDKASDYDVFKDMIENSLKINNEPFPKESEILNTWKTMF